MLSCLTDGDCYVCSIGAFIPLTRRPRFESSSSKTAWVLNVLMSLVAIGLIIAVAVVVSNHKSSYYYCNWYNCSNNNTGYYYNGYWIST